ncbi:hypothetical protein SeMB42_g03574 [Synchytrium endobioticum]|uniref:L-2-hydroxyglutarate dehydrogenase, mitochondrial n=1 Tax=Synchytrium endobioticum TaxID=286115 RepID=A0A507D5L8_9FUNG|nr:hypothetical protein SeMB42_g03574 [Synchytrium endobioticum]
MCKRLLHTPIIQSRSRHLVTAAPAPHFNVDHVVIGAGVVGLAIAERLSRRQRTSTLVLERHQQFGMEASSRNSEVIHAGIYYPPTSLKTRLCIRGRELLYRVCAEARIPCSKIGKWIVAVSDDEVEYLLKRKGLADELGVPTRWLARRVIQEGEPNLVAAQVLESRETGIVDSHSLMQYLEARVNLQNGNIIYSHPVQSIQKCSTGYIVRVGGPTPSTIQTRILINASGLCSDLIASQVLPLHYGPNTQTSIRYVKGHYFGLRGPPPVKPLIYPCPEKEARDTVTSLGVHCTLDLNGRLRFGPDRPDDYKIDVADEYLAGFHAAIQRYLPAVRKEDLYPDYTGILKKPPQKSQKLNNQAYVPPPNKNKKP